MTTLFILNKRDTGSWRTVKVKIIIIWNLKVKKRKLFEANSWRNGGPEKDRWEAVIRKINWYLFAGGVLCDGLGALTDGMFGQLTRKQETDSGLDLPRGDGAAFVVVSQTASLGWDTFKDIVDERVHDRHSLWWDTGIRVHLFQHFVNVNTVTFLSPLLLFLVTSTYGFSLTGLLSSFGWNLGWHVDDSCAKHKTERAAETIGLYTARRGNLSSTSESMSELDQSQRVLPLAESPLALL